MGKKEDKHIDPQQFSPDVRDFLQRLAVNDVRYLIVGGRAVIFHGHARMTGDVDIFYENGARNAEALFSALNEFWEGDVPGISCSEELQEDDLILQFGRPPNRLDLISDLTSVEFGEAWENRAEAYMETSGSETMIHFIGCDQLLKNKEAIGRPKDRDDCQYLKRPSESE